MIKVNEIRVGNWVSATENFEKFPAPMKVIGVGTASYSCQGNHEEDDFGVTTHSHPDYIKSWPYEQIHHQLTFKILEKAGFKEDDREGEVVLVVDDQSIHYFSTKDNYMGKKCFKLFNGLGDAESYGYELTNIKYVHQLQNLYFCLTGEELNIEL